MNRNQIQSHHLFQVKKPSLWSILLESTGFAPNNQRISRRGNQGGVACTAEVFEERVMLSAPEFASNTFTYSVAENDGMNGTEVAVGTPTATDAQGDSLTYSVVGGDPSGLFYFDSQGTLMAGSRT